LIAEIKSMNNNGVSSNNIVKSLIEKYPKLLINLQEVNNIKRKISQEDMDKDKISELLKFLEGFFVLMY